MLTLLALDVLVSDDELPFPIGKRWRQEFEQTGISHFKRRYGLDRTRLKRRRRPPHLDC
jgi:hypothetical protein